MAYLFGYQMAYLNADEIDVEINIYDTHSGTGTTVFEPIVGSDDPFHIFIVDNDESKASPIRAKQVEIKFPSTYTANLNSFVGSEDNRWYVEILVGGNIIFKGFCILDDMDEDFLDSDASNVVTLIATDNLGVLKDEKLTKVDGTNPRGYFRIMTYIAWCLRKSGLELPINVVHNVKEEHDPVDIMYSSCYLQAKTFEADINESVSAYEALEMILGQDAYCTQANGEWWVIRPDEIQDNATIQTVFDADGEFVQEQPFNPVQVFSHNSVLEFSEKNTFVKIQQAAKEVKLIYNYDLPKEIIDNIDFSQGAVSTVTPPPDYVYYDVDYWTMKKNNNAAIGGDGVAFIVRKFETGYEKERYLALRSNVPGLHYLASSRVPIHEKDKFDISVDSNYGIDIGGGFFRHNTIQVILYADNGNFWSLHGGSSAEPAPYWSLGTTFISGSVPPSGNRYIVTEGNLGTDDMRVARGVYKTTDYPPVPADGELEVRLISATSGLGNEKYFSNLRFTYIPYINGSYAKYSGQHNKISQPIGTKKVVEEDVRISDSPKKLFKGALFYNNGSKFLLTTKFYDGRQFPVWPPGDLTYRHAFGYNQVFCIWNQNNRPFRIFDFNAQGLNSIGLYPEIIHKYRVNETTAHTTNKYFMMLHYDQNANLCSWKGVMCEVFDTTLPKDYASDFEFKYIGENE